MYGLLARVRSIWHGLWRRAEVEAEMDAEFALHLQLRAEDLIRSGLPPHAAARQARLEFGGVDRYRELARTARGTGWLDPLAQDLRFGLRTFRRAPAFAATAVLTLALATGVGTAIFSVVNAVLLRPLPFADPERLVQVESGCSPAPCITWTNVDAIREHSTTVEAIAAYQPATRHLDGAAGPQRLTAVFVDGGLFPLLGAAALAGRTIRDDDPPDVVLISAALWRREFGADPTLPGRSILLSGETFTVVGVMPDRFQFPYGAASVLPGSLSEARTDLWIPYPPDRRGRPSSVVARLNAGVSVAAAGEELTRIVGRASERAGAGSGADASRGAGANSSASVGLAPLADAVLAPVRGWLWLLLAAVALVLAAACANIANLVLARMLHRRGEFAARAALGAGRARLIRQLATESLLLSLAGGLGGAVLAWLGLDMLLALAASKIPRAHEVMLDWQAFAFLLAVCVTAALLFGLAPALAVFRADDRALMSAGGRATMSRACARARDGLAVGQVALAFVLALGAALVITESARLRNTATGLQTTNVLSLHITPRADAADYDAIEQRAARLPSVVAAGFTQLLPLQNWGWEASFSLRDRPDDAPGEDMRAGLRYVTPGYFATLGIPVLSGRGFTSGDRADAAAVILVNQALARRYFQGVDPVGRRTDRGTIIGVVGDVRSGGADRPAEPELYYPVAQNVAVASDIGMSLVVRAESNPVPLVAALRTIIRDVNPNLAVFNVRSMDRVFADSLWKLHLYRWLLGAFAALAVVLVAVGVYGVISCGVQSRMQELAVRVSLGAAPSRVARLVLGRGVLLAVAGIAAGAVATFVMAPWVRDLPFGVSAGPWTFAGVAALLLIVALMSCTVPALRAAAIEPASALRRD